MDTWRDAKNIILVLLTVACLAIIGCRGLMDGATPGWMPKQSAKYLGDPNAAGLTNLNALKEARTDIIVTHRDKQIDLMRMAQDDKIAYQDAIGFIDTNIQDSQTMQDLVVGSEDTPFSILGILAGFTGGAAIGRALKRKGDMTPEEAERKYRSEYVVNVGNHVSDMLKSTTKEKNA